MRVKECLLATAVVLIACWPVAGLTLDPETDAEKTVTSEGGVTTQKSMDEIAREMSNPQAAFLSLGYQLDYSTYQGSIPGADDQNSMAHVMKGVIPFGQKDNGKGWVFRFALPYYPDTPIYWTDEKGYPRWLIRQDDPTPQGGLWAPTHGHTGDLNADLVYGGISDSGLILMYGIASIMPTSSDTSNNRQQLILGPEVNIGKMTDKFVYGAVISQIFDVVEKKDKGTPDTSQTTIEGYFSYALGNGWQLVSTPVITYDWKGDSGNKLSLPLGGGIAKTTSIGKMPLRVTAEVQKYVVSTNRFDFDWLFKFTITPVYPNRYTRN